MSGEDRARWDARHGEAESRPPSFPEAFDVVKESIRGPGFALDVACGTGRVSVWLAQQGYDVVGLDISPVGLDQARRLAVAYGVAKRCRFEVVDLDDGLPAGPAVNVIVCHLFWDRSLIAPMAERLAPGGVFAVAVLTGEGEFRARPGELRSHPAITALDPVASGSDDGREWVVGTRPI